MKKCLLLLFVLGLGGCASIVSDSTQSMAVNTYPDGADVKITNSKGKLVHHVKTPSVVVLNKSDGSYFGGETYHILLSKEGYRDKYITVESEASGWYMFGNILLGGLIGYLIVDPLTGAMYKLTPNDIEETLERNEATLFNGNRFLMEV